MKKKQEPRIVYSPLFGQWFLLTKYRKVAGIDTVNGKRKNYLRATEKHDITDQMVTIIREVERRTLARKRKKAGMSGSTKSLAEWLRLSVRSGLLFGRFDEPLDDYGKRIVRVILVELEQAESADAVRLSVDEPIVPLRA